MRVLVLSLGMMLWACGGGGSPTDDPDGGQTSDAGPQVPDAGSPWDAVGALLEARAADAGTPVPGLGLAGYYAILGMQLDRQGEGVVGFSVRLSTELQPLIRAALAR